jgi:predicted type IV restriction endonuclease
MDLIDRIEDLANRVPKQLEYCLTEEATKTALVMPFINALGYDVFNPREVVPEFIADYGIKKGEKVDYAIYQNGIPILLFECKWSGADLNKVHASQLYRYFSVLPDVRFGVLTNGVEYRFFTDLDKPNVMDERPFFIFDLLSYQDRHVDELKKFSKSRFNLDEILTTASELKYTAAIRKIIAAEFDEPSDDFVVFLSRQVYSGRMTHAARQQFTELVKQALRRYLSDKINERLQSAMAAEAVPGASVTLQLPEPVPAEPSADIADANGGIVRRDTEKGIVTTEDEIEGLFAVKSILRDTIDAKRIHMRDAKSYCSILLDDNNRKPVCRLYFNRDQKYVGFFDRNKNETRIPITDIDDIYAHAERLTEALSAYEAPGRASAPKPEAEVKGTFAKPATDFTGKELVAVSFRGKRNAVSTWKEGMLAVLSILAKERPKTFRDVAVTMVGRKRPFITANAEELRQPEVIPGTNLFVEANLGARSIANLCYTLLQKLEYAQSELAFEVA